jgi:16S rRNA (cytosine1402-N4)-methyltransferase
LEYPHQPVLVHEVVKYLVSRKDGTYVDGTVGSGGHSVAIGKRLSGSGKGRLICLDRDPEAVRLSEKRLAFLGNNVCVKKANFADLDNVLKILEIREVQGVLLDLGMSSFQIEKSGRGFSFSRNEPLDMRMDPDETLTAGYIVNNLSSKEIERILRDFGEERRAKLIARAIVSERSRKPIDTSSRLAALTKSVFPPPSRRSKAQHPATRTFQALRIAVNRELENLEVFLKKIPLLMAKGGRLVVLSYHSLEDRPVKQAMFDWEKGCTCPPDFPKCVCGKTQLFKRLIKKGIKPSQEEIEDNPRARSARLRAAERI